MGEATNLNWLDGFLNHQQYGYILGSGYFSLRLEVGIFLDASTGRLFKVIKDMLNQLYFRGNSIWPIQTMHDFSEKSLNITT